MNFSDFKKRLGAEPLSRDPEVLAARESAQAFDAAAREAEAFEKKLEDSLRLPLDGDALVDSVMQNLDYGDVRRIPPRWFAMAASLFVVIGITAVTLVNRGPTPLESYVKEHYEHDGEALLARARGTVPETQVQAVLTRLGANANAALASRVQFIKICPTSNNNDGAHMVVSTGAGNATVIFMPDLKLDQPVLVSFDGIDAEVVPLQAGAAALIGVPKGHTAELEAVLRQGISAQSADA